MLQSPNLTFLLFEYSNSNSLQMWWYFLDEGDGISSKVLVWVNLIYVSLFCKHLNSATKIRRMNELQVRKKRKYWSIKIADNQLCSINGPFFPLFFTIYSATFADLTIYVITAIHVMFFRTKLWYTSHETNRETYNTCGGCYVFNS